MNPKLLSIKKELKAFTKYLYEKYKDEVHEHTDIIIDAVNKKLIRCRIMFEAIPEPTKNEEIFYFKRIRAKLLAIIYLCNYIKAFDDRVLLSKTVKLRKQCLKELARTKKKIVSIYYYYSYFKSKATHSDEKFFLRLHADIVRPLTDVVLEIDSKSNTPYLFLFAKSEALYIYKEHLKQKINNYSIADTTVEKNNTLATIPPIVWTASKTDLTELVYALHAAGVFNHGKASLKEIVDTFQDVFQVDIGHHNRTFYDIKLRKKFKTKHIDQLKEVLLKKINETDYELFIE